MKTDKMGEARGRPSWRSSFLGDPGARFLLEDGAEAQNKKKLLARKKPGQGLFILAFPP